MLPQQAPEHGGLNAVLLAEREQRLDYRLPIRFPCELNCSHAGRRSARGHRLSRNADGYTQFASGRRQWHTDRDHVYVITVHPAAYDDWPAVIRPTGQEWKSLKRLSRERHGPCTRRDVQQLMPLPRSGLQWVYVLLKHAWPPRLSRGPQPHWPAVDLRVPIPAGRVGR